MALYLGDVSAYAYAVSQGYEGTEEEYAELMASYATVAEEAAASATAAAESATAAASSETNAATSETNAAASATAAASSESNAASSESNASASETAAASSATAAATSATNAAASETNAAASATAAASSESNAATSESNAADSATAAAASATAAAGYASAWPGSIAPTYDSTATYNVGDHVMYGGQLYQCVSAITTAEEWTAAHWNATKIFAYDDIGGVIKITDSSTTLGDISDILDDVNTAGDHVDFDVAALGAGMYRCMIFIDTDEGVYKINDLVKARIAEGTYDSSTLLSMAIAMASDVATQGQIDYLQKEIDELGGSSAITNLDVLGDLILSGESTDLIDPGDTIDFNWIDTVLGTTTNGLTVTCSDPDAFITEMGEAEETTYLFVYDGSDWTYDGDTVDLEDYGLTVTGTPATGEVMTIKTTVNAVSHTFVSYDTANPSDSDVTHHWVMEETYAPNAKSYDAYEALFMVYAGKTVPVGEYHLRNYCYRSGFYIDMYLSVTSAIGDSDSAVRVDSTGYTSGQSITNADGTTKTGVSVIKGLAPRIYGTRTTASGAVSIAYSATSGVTYTELEDLNTDANDPVVYVESGVFDKCVYGNNCWPRANISEWMNDETAAKESATPSYPLDVPSAYNLNAGGLYGLDPRAKALIQYCSVPWIAGYGNTDSVGAYARATGTAPASGAPTYYEKTGSRGAWVYTALDPQPSSGDDVSDYYVYTDNYAQGYLYETDQRVFLLSMKEMSFNIQTAEGNVADLYSEYTGGTLTNDAVAARAKYNKAGGTLNNYRWSRSAYSSYAFHSRNVTSTGSNYGYAANNSNYYARAFIIGKKSS